MIEHTRAIHTPRAVMTMPPSWLVDGFVAAVERAKAADDADEDTARGISIAVAEYERFGLITYAIVGSAP